MAGDEAMTGVGLYSEYEHNSNEMWATRNVIMCQKKCWGERAERTSVLGEEKWYWKQQKNMQEYRICVHKYRVKLFLGMKFCASGTA